jgi:hypothetical protein
MATAVFAETLENLQYFAWIIPERRNQTLNSIIFRMSSVISVSEYAKVSTE